MSSGTYQNFREKISIDSIDSIDRIPAIEHEFSARPSLGFLLELRKGFEVLEKLRSTPESAKAAWNPTKTSAENCHCFYCL